MGGQWPESHDDARTGSTSDLRTQISAGPWPSSPGNIW